MTAIRNALATALALGAVAAFGVLPPGASAINKHCANVTFASPYSHKAATARVAVRRGSIMCASARGVIRKALSTKNWQLVGLTRVKYVGSWFCSEGGDGTVTFCTKPGKKVESTTPTAGGFWAHP